MNIREKHLVLFLVLIIFCQGCGKTDNAKTTSIEPEKTYITNIPIPTENVIETLAKTEETSLSETPTPTIEEKIHITELKCDNGDMFEEIEQFAMIASEPFILSNGKAYVLREENWTEYISDDNLIELYKGESFCALNDKGEIIVADELEKIRKEDEATVKEIEETRGNLGAGHGALLAHAESIVEKSKNVSVKSLSNSAFWIGEVLVLFENGNLSMFSGSKEIPVTGLKEIKKVSGNYILTNDGTVYYATLNEQNYNIGIKELISNEPVVDISAAGHYNNCLIAIKEDGSVIVLNDLKKLVDSGFTYIAEADMGIDYCVAVNENEEVLFSAYDDYLYGVEQAINELLVKNSKNAVKVVADVRKISILNEDMTVTIIDFKNYK